VTTWSDATAKRNSCSHHEQEWLRSGTGVAQEAVQRCSCLAFADCWSFEETKVCETSRRRAARASPGNNKTSWRQLSLMSTCGLRLEVWWPWNRMTNDVPDPMTQRRTCSSSPVPTPSSSQLQLHVEPFAFTPLHSTPLEPVKQTVFSLVHCFLPPALSVASVSPSASFTALFWKK
jgi:hypothetical protein